MLVVDGAEVGRHFLGVLSFVKAMLGKADGKGADRDHAIFLVECDNG